MARFFTIAAGTFGLIGVLAGTFGAHGLRHHARPEDAAVWETAVRYQMYHGLALLFIAWAGERLGPRLAIAAGWLFTGGILVFSGSLYALALSESLFGQRQSWLGMVTPIGGACFIAGWCCLTIGAFRSRPPVGAR